jgi:uncharacterized protein with HEPN domain
MNEDVRLNTHVAQMLESVELAMSYVEGQSQAEFVADRKTQQAAVLNLIVIGEIATKIERDFPEFAAQQSHIPWKSMRGMRNRIAHGYFEIDLSTVWDTLQTALPELLAQLRLLPR